MRVTLNGYVIPTEDQWLYDWFGIDAFSPGRIREAIKNNPEGEDLVFEINSGGGDVFSGFEMYSVIRNAKCHTVAQVQSIAASAASTVMIGCDSVELSPVAQVMIHLPSCCTSGNRNAHMDSVNVLDSITQSILNAYELRCGSQTDRARLLDLMRQEAWLPAQDAVELGLADKIMFHDEEQLSPTILNAAGEGIRSFVNGIKMPDITALRTEYDRRVAAGEKPSEHCPDNHINPAGAAPAENMPWQAMARLEIEKHRFD